MRKGLFAFFSLAFCSFLFAQQALNNDAVVRMVNAGLSDEVIITTINSSPGAYDSSANALVALKTAGVGDKVIAAILVKGASGPASAVPALSFRSDAPDQSLAGITDIGVYYKDQSGSWTSILSEVVNFKTGGIFKTIATAGLIKSDVNGNIQGRKAKLSLPFPVVLAVYLPEGIDITEYQLLRLRVNSSSREFRSVTGGVLHSSGGASRDAVDFQPQKLSPRVYQITLDAAIGKGEYGLLPPGSLGSANMASAGKIYAISIGQ
jgi:hypothetical protein